MATEQFFDQPMLVLARRISQSDCREEAYADGSVWEIGVATSVAQFNEIRSVAEITAKMCDDNEILDIWMEEAP